MTNDMQLQEAVELKIDKEFQKLIRPLNDEERQKLEDSLLAEGCRDSLVVWKGENILLDGHNRLEICDTHDIEYYVVEVDLPDREHAILWVRENQLGRRNLTQDQQAVMCVEVVEARSAIEKKKRARKGGKTGGVGRPKENSLVDETTTKLSDEPKEKTRATVAKEFNVPENKLRDVAKIKKDDPQAFDEIANGETSVREAKKEMKKRESAKQPKPEKRYPHSDQLWDLINHIDNQITAMKEHHETVAEMVEDDKWDKRETNKMAECLRRNLRVLSQYEKEFRLVSSKRKKIARIQPA